AEGSVDGHSQLPELTAREAQVFLLLARGHSVARVAATVGIHAKTAYAHRTNIYGKLKLGSDHELRLLAMKRGLIGRAEAGWARGEGFRCALPILRMPSFAVGWVERSETHQPPGTQLLQLRLRKCRIQRLHRIERLEPGGLV